MLMQFDTDPDATSRRNLVKSSGATVIETEPKWPAFFDAVQAQRPDLIVIACSRLPSHARDAARYLGEGFNTRDIPVILVDIPEDKADAFKAYVAKYNRRSTVSDRAGLPNAIRSALGSGTGSGTPV